MTFLGEETYTNKKITLSTFVTSVCFFNVI